MTEEEFTAWVGRDGFDHTRSVEYQPDDRPPMHAHDFDARVLVTRGEMTMVFDGESVVLGPGDHCEVPARSSHSEQGSDVGAAGLLATRSLSV